MTALSGLLYVVAGSFESISVFREGQCRPIVVIHNTQVIRTQHSFLVRKRLQRSACVLTQPGLKVAVQMDLPSERSLQCYVNRTGSQNYLLL